VSRPIGIFGGTFDPIHYGHLRTAFELGQCLALAQVRFVPAGDPPHREPPLAPAALRLEMVRAATAGEPLFTVDDREIRRSGRSYTVDTLAELRDALPGSPLYLLVGMDAFLGLPDWHRWREIFDLAHVVVAQRPGWEVPAGGVLSGIMAGRRAGEARELQTAPCGRVLIQPVTQLEIASTDLRHLLLTGRDLRYLVPEAVREIVLRSGCYAPGGH